MHGVEAQMLKMNEGSVTAADYRSSQIYSTHI
jgi:hypothetical protein